MIVASIKAEVNGNMVYEYNEFLSLDYNWIKKYIIYLLLLIWSHYEKVHTYQPLSRAYAKFTKWAEHNYTVNKLSLSVVNYRLQTVRLTMLMNNLYFTSVIYS